MHLLHRPAFYRPATAAGAALGLACSAAVMGTSPSTAAAPPPALRILLTNDDGYAAPGLAALREALSAAGHAVTVVAPATNQSGSSGRATFGGILQVTRLDASTYAVTGSPVDAVEVGLGRVFADAPPDLVVSGANAGQNIGAAVPQSGTVGAAVAAIEDGVPAIAVSTESTAASTPYADTARFVVRLAGALAQRRGRDGLLPDGLGLNVNYPVVEDGSAPSPALVETGRGFLDLTHAGTLPEVGQTTALTVGVDLAVPETVKHADTTALARNRITVAVIEGDYGADRSTAQQVGRRLLARLR